jgi:Cupin-like domain
LPGDAIYIPPLWWHHVASRKPLNLLVNYWWTLPGVGSGLGALLQARSAFGAFPPAQRQAWAALLAHWVFEADEATVAHIPPGFRGPTPHG